MVNRIKCLGIIGVDKIVYTELKWAANKLTDSFVCSEELSTPFKDRDLGTVLSERLLRIKSQNLLGSLIIEFSVCIAKAL